MDSLHSFAPVALNTLEKAIPVAGPITLLNAPVVTANGHYLMRTISTREAKSWVQRLGFTSAIGHENTAQSISRLLEIDCPFERREFRQAPGQAAIIFRLKKRLEEGRILMSQDELEDIGFSFAMLVRLA